MDRKLNILLISSESLYKSSSRLALDQYQALKANGHDVEVLTKYDASNNKDIISVTNQLQPSIIRRVYNKIARPFRTKDNRGKYYFFYTSENRPPVPVRQVLQKIKTRYDLVLVTFWQGLLSAKTVYEIQKKTNCPILFLAVDMSPLTGGCHYYWDCEKFKTGCGCCPAMGSTNPKDFTNFNSQYRHDHFAKINGAFLGNDYMNEIAKTSYALANFNIEKGAIVVNESQFCPRDKKELREEFGIPYSKKFIIFAGAQTIADPRKGMNILIESLNAFYNFLPTTEKDELLILFAGNATDQLLTSVKFDTKSLGYVDYDTLAKAYALVDLYLSPSILDAGPMMVNQSLSCGTPVVAFEIGCALEVVKGHNTGYCAKLADVEDFTKGISYIYGLTETQRQEMSNDCRNIAMKSSSYINFVENTIRVYNKMTTTENH